MGAGQGIKITNNRGGGTSIIVAGSLIENRDIFSATPAQTVFVTSFSLTGNNFDVFANGYLVNQNLYSRSSGNSITFNAGQDENTEVIIQNYTVSGAALSKELDVFASTVGQTVINTSFDIGDTYDVFVDGYIVSPTKYTKTGADQITFDAGQDENSEIIIRNYHL